MTAVIDRLYQYTALAANSNKFWHVKAHELPSGNWRVVTEFSRVGHMPQASARTMSKRRLDSLIASKERKGYKVVERAATASGDGALRTIDKRVADTVQMLFAAAGEYIDSYLATTVDALSADQINKGRRLLTHIQNLHTMYKADDVWLTPLVDAVQEYYVTIPTRLPHRIDPVNVVATLCEDFREQEERLDQLDAAVAGLNVDLAATLGAQLEPVEGDEWMQVRRLIASTIQHNRFRRCKLDNVFHVTIPDERHAYDAQGDIVRRRLFHGTRTRNGRHILRTGLIIPSTAANGSMFGRGIYFADCASKSMQYCGGRGHPNILLVADVAVGKPYVAPDANHSLVEAPRGYDSVLGKAGHTRSWGGRLKFNEFIVYRQQQQTIRYLVIWRE